MDDDVILPSSAEDMKCECGGTQFIEDSTRGDTICENCGIVLPDRLRSLEAEWRSFASEPGTSSRNRTATINPLFASISSTAPSKPGAQGAQGAQRNLTSQIDKAVAAVVSVIDGLAESKGMVLSASIVDRAKELCKKIHQANCRGHNKTVLAATAIFVACRQEEVPRSMKEICALADVKKSDLQKCSKAVRKALDLQIGVPATAEFIPRLCQDLDIEIPRHVKACKRVSERLNEMQQGRNPNSIAAASVYMVTRVTNPTLKLARICKSAGVAETTVTGVVKTANKDSPPIDIKAILAETGAS